MFRILTISGMIGILFACLPGTAQMLLFNADFDKGVAAQSAKGSGDTAITAGLTDVGDGYKGGTALQVKPGMVYTENDMEVLYSPLIYNAGNNFDSKKGTIEFRVRLTSLPTSSDREERLALVGISDWRTLPGPEWGLEGCDHYAYIAFVINGKEQKIIFAEHRQPVKYDLAGMEATKNKHFELSSPVSWKINQWHHIALTWEARTNLRTLFIDGRKAAEGTGIFDDKLLVPKATQLAVGGIFKRSLISLSCMIDSVRVYDTPIYTKNFNPEKEEK